MTNFASITQQEIIRLLDSHNPLVMHDLLIKEFGYMSLEGTGLSENGAYFIHPKDWPKSDIVSGKQCWPAMELAGMQFIGINGPKEIKFYDGLINGKPCELKFIQPKAEIKTQDKLVTNIKEHLLKANRQGAEIAIVVISKVVNPEKFNWDQIQSRIDGSISKQYHTLKRAILLFDK